MSFYVIGSFLVVLALVVFLTVVDIMSFALIVYAIKDRRGVEFLVFLIVFLIFFGLTIISLGKVFGI